MRYLLDTNTCVFFLRGKLNLDEIIKEKGRQNCFISEITVVELRYGAENSDNPLKSHKSVGRFCERAFNNSNFWFYKTIRPGESATEKNRQTNA